MLFQVEESFVGYPGPFPALILEPFNQVGQARKVEMTLPTKCAVETSEGECHTHDGPSQAPPQKKQ